MNLFTYPALADGAGLFLAVAVKGSLIFLTAILVVAMLRRASAATRHAVWAFALGAALLLPALFVVLPGWQVPVLPPSPSASVTAFPTPPAPPAVPAAPAAPAAPTIRGLVAPTAPRVQRAPRSARPPMPPVPRLDREVQAHVFSERGRTIIVERHASGAPLVVPMAPMPHSLPVRDWKSLLVVIWAVGAFVIVARWFLAVLGAWRLVQRAEPVYDLDWLELKERVAFGMDLRRPVRLLRSDRLTVPVAGGVFDPVVVLPPEADEWDEDRREVVLTHEMAHIVRRDCLTQSLAQGSLALHWFNPLAWITYRRFMVDREHACDDYVLNHGARASDYAQHLVQIARRFRKESLALAATAPMARRSNLEGRVLSILDPAQNRGTTTRTDLATVGVVALALAVPLAAFQPVQGEADSVTWKPAAAMVAPVTPLKASGFAFQSSDDTFTWEGRVSSGGFVEVHGVNGSIRAESGSGDRVRVEAEKKSERGMEDEVEIIVKEFANGVVICAIYPGQRNECEPGQGTEGNVRDNDVQVTFDIRLPESVRFVGRTVNGSVKTGDLGADVEAYTVNGSIETASRRGHVTAKTVNGSIRAEAAGLVRAHTVNGSITARMGQEAWEGGMGFETTNGSITLEVPDTFSADVRAKSQSGSIKSDFPLRIDRNGYVGSEARGELGSGGAELRLDVMNGSIKLRRSSGTFGSRIRRETEVDREYERRVEREALRHVHIDEPDFAAIEEALESIGPVMEQAMAEAGRAMAEIDFQGEIASALNDIDWDDIQADVDLALAEAAEEMNAVQIEAWAEAEADLEEALEDLRVDLDEVNAELAEMDDDDLALEWSESERRVAKENLRAARAALKKVERELERVRCETQARHANDHDEDCRDNR